MPTIPDIRAALVMQAPAVPDSIIQSTLDSSQALVTLEVGEEFATHPIALEFVRLKATAAAMRVADALDGERESPAANVLDTQASELIEVLQQATGVDASLSSESFITNILPASLWTPYDLDLLATWRRVPGLMPGSTQEEVGMR